MEMSQKPPTDFIRGIPRCSSYSLSRGSPATYRQKILFELYSAVSQESFLFRKVTAVRSTLLKVGLRINDLFHAVFPIVESRRCRG